MGGWVGGPLFNDSISSLSSTHPPTHPPTGLAMIMSSLSVVVSSLALRVYRRPDLERIGRRRRTSFTHLRFRRGSERVPLVAGGEEEEEDGGSRGRRESGTCVDPPIHSSLNPTHPPTHLLYLPIDDSFSSSSFALSRSLASERARATSTHTTTSSVISRVSRLWHRLRGYDRLEGEGEGRGVDDFLSSLEASDGRGGRRGSIDMVRLGRQGSDAFSHRETV